MTDAELDSLSGVELRRRLSQREVPDEEVEHLVSHRNYCSVCRELMKELL